MPRIAVDGVELNVLDRGEGDAVLFVHGFPLDHTMWQAQVDVLADTHRVIVPDLRGFGQSDVTPDTVTMEQFADDLDGLLDALHVDSPVTLCGLSMGGYIAWQFVRRHSERLGALVVCDTRAAPDTPEAAEGRLKSAEAVLREGPAPIADSMGERLFSPSTFQQQPELPQRVRQTILNTPPEGIAAALRGMAVRPDVTPLLPGIRVPTLVIVGADDRISPPEEMRQIAQAIPGAGFVEVRDAGHVAPVENPNAVNAALKEFLSRLPR